MGRRLDWQSKQRYPGINEIKVEECLNWTRLDSIADSQFKTGDWHLCIYVHTTSLHSLFSLQQTCKTLGILHGPYTRSLPLGLPSSRGGTMKQSHTTIYLWLWYICKWESEGAVDNRESNIVWGIREAFPEALVIKQKPDQILMWGRGKTMEGFLPEAWPQEELEGCESAGPGQLLPRLAQHSYEQRMRETRMSLDQ